MSRILSVLSIAGALWFLVLAGCWKPPGANVADPYRANSNVPVSQSPGYNSGSGARSAPVYQGSGSR